MVLRFLSVFVFGTLFTIQSLASDVVPFPDARVMYEQTKDNSRYTLALGGLKKINGIWEIEKVQRLTGRVERQTREILSTRSFNFALKEFQMYLDEINARPMFSCENLDCGSSNAWANERFKIKQLQ